MSDLSLPPLTLVPLVPLGADTTAQLPPAGQVPQRALAPAAAVLAWPALPGVGYGATPNPGEPEPCELEGPNGKVSNGRLVGFDPDAGQVQVLIPPGRNLLTLRFTQFRRLSLLRPLEPLPAADSPRMGATTPLLPQNLLQPYRLRFKDGTTTTVASVGLIDKPLGLFTFSPVDASGRLLRSLYPRPMLVSVQLAPPGAAAWGDGDQDTAPMALDDLPSAHPPQPPSLGDMLGSTQIATAEQLAKAIDQQARMPMVRIGEALVGLGFITEGQLAEALRLQLADRRLPLGELLVSRGDVTRADLQTALSRKMGYPIVEVGAFPVESEAVLRLPLAAARRLGALPLMMRAGRLVVALEDPSVRVAIDEIEFNAQCKVLPVLARAGTLASAIDRVYLRLGKDAIEPSAELSASFNLDADGGDNANKLLASMEQEQSPSTREDEPQIGQSDNSLVRLINTMILEARQGGVSDIHIECQPGTQKVQVRFRRDGVLKPYIELPHTYRSALVARIKIMCDLDISERRKPQDGKINFGRWMQNQKLELRVATIPTANGLEDVVMRLLASAKTLPLEGMGMQPDTLARLKTAIERPYGMVLCVGPTGSGKTTTLHAALGHINTPERKIWTAEDPVEITQPGLRQVQVNPKIDWTFAKALRAFLRADPDVVMVGEIRDAETAGMAVEASLTGHLVMSTLHTNSAPETVTRLLDMGMDPFSFADSLLAVLAQRLVRRLCKHCVTTRPATAEDLQGLVEGYLFSWPDASQRPDGDALVAEWTQRFGVNGRLLHHHAPGCSHCDNGGYAGRVGLHELLVVSRELRHLIQTSARAGQLQQAAMNEGMRTLRQDGILKVLAGLTSVEEVRAISNG
ncbi:MAG: ATPase, T2SS/T4P/T4SS family [Aquabacterium sp.]|nr:ATPase, T2SS/T4P/T4SS family [Aquabacterium sp.]